jgi:hypothetical protein
MENILRCIAREANRSGDAKTLFHALDLLEHLIPMATGRVDAFMTFCAELETEGDGWKARRRADWTLNARSPAPHGFMSRRQALPPPTFREYQLMDRQ